MKPINHLFFSCPMLGPTRTRGAAVARQPSFMTPHRHPSPNPKHNPNPNIFPFSLRFCLGIDCFRGALFDSASAISCIHIPKKNQTYRGPACTLPAPHLPMQTRKKKLKGNQETKEDLHIEKQERRN